MDHCHNSSWHARHNGQNSDLLSHLSTHLLWNKCLQFSSRSFWRFRKSHRQIEQEKLSRSSSFAFNWLLFFFDFFSLAILRVDFRMMLKVFSFRALISSLVNRYTSSIISSSDVDDSSIIVSEVSKEFCSIIEEFGGNDSRRVSDIFTWISPVKEEIFEESGQYFRF